MRAALAFTALLLWLPSAAMATTILAARTSGVAPLLVSFENSDAPASTGTTLSTFHTNEHRWDFGDTNAGSWATSGKPKNVALGPVSAHVFETAGTYTVTLTERSADGTVIGSDTETITVSDPESVYTGTLTTCVNKVGDADFTGCPTGAAQINNDDLTTSAVTSAAGNGERLLLKRGSAWSVASVPAFPSSTGTTIGAYGTCTTPDSAGRCSNAPHITLTGATDRFILFQSKHDYRVMDLKITGSTTSGGQSVAQFLLLRIEQDGVGGNGLGIMGWSHSLDATLEELDQLGVVDCKIRNGFNHLLYLGGMRLALMGIDADYVNPSEGGSHAVRVWQLYKGVIQHNRFSGAGYDPTPDVGRLTMKLHGPGFRDEFFVPPSTTVPAANEFCEPEDNGEGANQNCLSKQTSLSVVSDNVFGASGPITVSVGPQDPITDSYTFDLIFERNRFSTDYGHQYATNIVNASLLSGASYSSYRNNILDIRSTQNEWRGISVVDAGDAPQANYCHVANNTCRSVDVGGGSYYNCVYVGTSDVGNTTPVAPIGTVVRNTLASFPNLSGTANEYAVLDAGTNSVISNNLLLDDPGFADADNTTPLSRSFALTASSTAAIDQGYTVAVRDDYLSNCRSGLTYDIGAYEYGAEPCIRIGGGRLSGSLSGGGVMR